MSRTLLFSLLMLLSYKGIFAEGHHHDEPKCEKKRDIVVIAKGDHHHHDPCEEKRSLKVLACQLARNHVRKVCVIVGGGLAYCNNQNKPNCLIDTALFTACAFTAGHAIREAFKWGMYLNNIPKQ